MLLLSWVCMLAEAGEVDFDHPAADPVQHQESVVDPALFKAVPFQTVKQQLYGTRCPVSEAVVSVLFCSTMYLFKQLGVFLLVLVEVPDGS